MKKHTTQLGPEVLPQVRIIVLNPELNSFYHPPHFT